MTIIAACVDQDGSVWMGADTVNLIRNVEVRPTARPKMFRLGEMLIGMSGEVRGCQIVEYLPDIEMPPDDTDLMKWLATKFVPPMREAMKQGGGELRESNADTLSGRLLIGIRGSIFEIDSSYGVCQPRSCFHAIGCADQEALAGMFTALKLRPDLHARKVVEYGLEAAAEYDLNIRPPFEIMCDLHEDIAALRIVG